MSILFHLTQSYHTGSEWGTFESWKCNYVYKKIGQIVGEIHFSIGTNQMIKEVEILKNMHDEFGFSVFHRQDNFRYTKLLNVPYSKGETKSVRTYRCIELGWRKSAQIKTMGTGNKTR